jgi:putative ABC transport system permease protein
LTDYLIEHTDDSTVVRAQERTPDVNVLNGMSFEPADDAEKIAETVEYLSRLNVSDKAALASNLSLSMPTDGLEGDAPADPAMMMQAVGAAASAAAPTESDLAAMLDTYLQDPADDVMLALYNSAISPGSYDDNMSAFGVVSLDAPASISIYADSFDDKDAITACIEDYNQTVSEKSQISYTDFVGLLMSSITTIINVISYVLIAFVAVSLVVSSIMIGIITYISVLERTREIGILRALGASKGNISQVFNAETFITGLISGALGVGIAYLLLLPTNIVIHMLTGTESVNAALPAIAVAALVCLSMVLSVIAGLIPSRKAARKDPVVALRTE